MCEISNVQRSFTWPLACEVLNIAKETNSSKKGEKVTNKLPLNLKLSSQTFFYYQDLIQYRFESYQTFSTN